MASGANNAENIVIVTQPTDFSKALPMRQYVKQVTSGDVMAAGLNKDMQVCVNRNGWLPAFSFAKPKLLPELGRRRLFKNSTGNDASTVQIAHHD